LHFTKIFKMPTLVLKSNSDIEITALVVDYGCTTEMPRLPRMQSEMHHCVFDKFFHDDAYYLIIR
jgi:hypothetical protein